MIWYPGSLLGTQSSRKPWHPPVFVEIGIGPTLNRAGCQTTHRLLGGFPRIPARMRSCIPQATRLQVDLHVIWQEVIWMMGFEFVNNEQFVVH